MNSHTAQARSGARRGVLTNLERLALTHPELAAQWHPTRNGDLSPNDVKPSSGKIVWWSCSKGHEWDTPVNKRAKEGYGCPYCAGQRVLPQDSLAALFPSVAAEWHVAKNLPLTPSVVRPGSNRIVWWQCTRNPNHVWQVRIFARTGQTSGCPMCSGRRRTKDNSFANKFPHIAAEWHPTRNGKARPEQFAATSEFKAWWQCAQESHEWQTLIRSRTARRSANGCPACARKSRVTGVRPTLAVSHPELGKQWHPDKNGDLTPNDVTGGSWLKVWWRCPTDHAHEWLASIGNRSRGAGCPFCQGQAVNGQNSLRSKNPIVAAEWHPTRNGELTPDHVTPGSSRSVWWQCRVNPDHEWEARIQPRATAKRITGCPFCAFRLTPEKSLATKNPEIAREWHPTKNLPLLLASVSAGSARKVWWRCSTDPTHEWQARVKNRTIHGSGCPKCRVGWTIPAIRSFVDGLKKHLNTFTSAELYVLFQQTDCLEVIDEGKHLLTP